MIAADGAGSAPRSDEGSKVACDRLFEKLGVWLASGKGVDELEPSFFEAWVKETLEEFAALGAEDLSPIAEFSTTILTAVLSDDCSVFVQIGDGAIVVGDVDEIDEYQWVFWPEQGEYANSTVFITSRDAISHLQFCKERRRLNEVAVFTDGIQRLALQVSNKSAHSPFFRSVFLPLRAASAQEKDGLCGAISRFLESKSVCDRTDDDKTLLLATRVEKQTTEVVA